VAASYQKIQYLPDSATFFRSFTYSSAPTRRRRKAGVGRTSPLSGACHLPNVPSAYVIQLSSRTHKIPLHVIRIIEPLRGGERLDDYALQSVENQGQGRGAPSTKPEMRKAGQFSNRNWKSLMVACGKRNAQPNLELEQASITEMMERNRASRICTVRRHSCKA
jgi:hypothetical protein